MTSHSLKIRQFDNSQVNNSKIIDSLDLPGFMLIELQGGERI